MRSSCAFPGSTFGIYTRFRSGMQIKQEPVNRLNLFNDTVFITVIVVSVLQCFIYRSGVALCGECSYVEEKSKYVIIIHGKTV